MEAKAGNGVLDRPGKTAFWTRSRAADREDRPDTIPGSTQPATLSVGTLDNVRSVFWQAYRHLFPPHSIAAESPNGSVVISWSIMDDPHAKYPYAAPVVLRFDADLLEAMSRAGLSQRLRIAQNHEPTLREGLRGYDPFARFPNARVINLG
jgi:hypothetical protein